MVTAYLFACFGFYDSGDGAVILEEDFVQRPEERFLRAGPLRRRRTRRRQRIYDKKTKGLWHISFKCQNCPPERQKN